MPGFINAESGVRSEVDPTAMRNARNQPKTNVRCIQKLTPNGLFSLCARVDKLPLTFLPYPVAFFFLSTEKCNQLEAKNVPGKMVKGLWMYFYL